ncbi:MAG: PEP-utilizing enzyme [Chloroflexota bacterium]
MSATFSNARWVVLGSGRSANLGVGNKARLLDLAARAGLPVPAGVIVLDDAWHDALSLGHLRRDSSVGAAGGGCAVAVADPTRLLAQLDLPAFARPIAVRSAFALEDAPSQSLAGYFTSLLHVDPRDDDALTAALATVWGSAERASGTFRRDILLLQMVSARWAGVAFSEQEHEDDLVNVAEGTADRLVSGEVAGETLLLPKLRPWERPPGAASLVPAYPFATRLQRLLRDLRRVFGPGDWDVEWADDGDRCWLIQLRPVTRPTRRDEAFTLANHKEILPELPSRFMASLVESCADRLFANYRHFDTSLPAHRPFIESFLGRPYINLSLLSEMMRVFGLPTRLVTDSIGGAAIRAAGPNPRRLLRKAPILARMGMAQLTAVESARHRIDEILARAERPGDSFAECVETLAWLYTALVGGMMSLTAAMSGPLAALRAVGVLEEHSSRHRTVATAIYDDLGPLRTLVQSRPELLACVRRGEAPADPQFQALWRCYLDRHGHRGIFESDIARPRFREEPAPLLAAIAHPESARPARPPRTLVGTGVLLLWWQSSRAMRARERLRSAAMVAFERVRGRLLTLADDAVARGALPSRDALWMLDVAEVCQLDAGWQPDPDFFQERAAEIAHLGEYHLPDLIHRSDDLEAYRAGRETADASSRVRGLSLTSGDVQGRAWVLSEPSTALPPGFESRTTVLVARSVDAGWIPTFGLVAGVVVETGGDLSHGSIVLREIGLPAITNAHGATRSFQSGDRIWLRAASGVAERLPPFPDSPETGPSDAARVEPADR